MNSSSPFHSLDCPLLLETKHINSNKERAMDEKQHTAEAETNAQMSRMPNQQTTIVVGASAIGLMIGNICNHEMAGQALWLRMLAAAASGLFVAGIIGFVWFKFWHTSWCKFWHTR